MKLDLVLYWNRAITAEIAINTTTSARMISTCFFSDISLMMLSLSRSMVSVEEDAITREDRVDMEADSTRITTSASIPEERPESMVGTTES